MGSQDQDKIDDENEKFYERLAQYIGITKDEIDNYADLLETREDGVQFLSFKSETPAHVLDKLLRIDDNNTIYFSQNELNHLID